MNVSSFQENIVCLEISNDLERDLLLQKEKENSEVSTQKNATEPKRADPKKKGKGKKKSPKSKKTNQPKSTSGKKGDSKAQGKEGHDSAFENESEKPDLIKRGRLVQKGSIDSWVISFKDRSSSRKRVLSAPTIENKKSRPFVV